MSTHKLKIVDDKFKGKMALDLQAFLESTNKREIEDPKARVIIKVRMLVYDLHDQKRAHRTATFDAKSNSLRWLDKKPVELLNLEQIVAAIRRGLECDT